MTPAPVPIGQSAIETVPDTAPVEAPEFASLMAALGPFESAPRLAVAVSGGADSMALALMADRWARERGGRVTALTVDHRLRRGSGKEARTVAGWLGARGIAHHSLQWRGAKPGTGRQAAAREARYALMQDWCRQQGCLHLLVAHHRQDQAETHLIRLEAGSGQDGLAGMPAIFERPHLRLLRPLLGVDKERLRANLRARSQDWIEDPSNNDPAYARTRLRADSGPLLAACETLTRPLGRRRARLEGESASLLARIAVFDARAGFCRFDREALAAGEPRLARRALARMLVSVSGSVHPPRGARLDRLLGALVNGVPYKAHTLAGCRIVPYRGDILVCREPSAARERIAVTGAGTWRWDNRYTLRIDAIGAEAIGEGALTIARLGRDGWAQITQAETAHRALPIPPPVRPSLPGFFAGSLLLAAPHPGIALPSAANVGNFVVNAEFAPTIPLAGPVFGVV